MKNSREIMPELVSSNNFVNCEISSLHLDSRDVKEGSVFFAIKDAIASVSKYKKMPVLDAPATPEKILMSLDELKNRLNYSYSRKNDWKK